MKRVFMIHGFEGEPTRGWFPWLKHELEKQNFSVTAPQMPNAHLPNVSEWIETLAKLVGTPDAETFFVGHSLGCITIARYLEQLPPDAQVGGCVFVAGFSGNIHLPEISEFYSLPFNPTLAASHAKKSVAIFSDNDEDVPFETAKAFAEEMSAEIVVDKGKGHFSWGEGVVELPSALEALLTIAK